MTELRAIDLFAGIGGFHIAFAQEGVDVIWASEWDKYARQTYEENFKKSSPVLFEKSGGEQLNFAGDITKVNPADIPDFDIVSAGFPCQPFSQAGYKKGFSETRGTLFFNIAQILEEKQPQAFFLENVRGLLKHDSGNTMRVIEKTIKGLGYSFNYKLIKASEYGLPTHRPRLFMVGFRESVNFEWPEQIPLKFNMSDVLGGKCPKEIGYTLRVGGRGSGINDRRNWDTYLVDGKEHRLTVSEGKKMMGFPDSFMFSVSETQAMKQLGNSVAIDAVQATVKQIVKAINGS